VHDGVRGIATRGEWARRWPAHHHMRSGNACVGAAAFRPTPRHCDAASKALLRFELQFFEFGRMTMIMLIAAAAVAAAQPAAPAPAQPIAQEGGPSGHKDMDCCKDCCKDMAKMHEGHAEHEGHKTR